MPRVIELANKYCRSGGFFAVVQVSEQQIMDNMILANRHGHIACTQGGESLAGLRKALELKLVNVDEHCIVDATAHHLKFIDFQSMYFNDAFPPEFGVAPKKKYQNHPLLLDLTLPKEESLKPKFYEQAARKIAELLSLTAK